MHACPKCSAYYANGSPPFCHVDGTPLVNVNPASDKWAEGSRVLRERENTLRRCAQKIKWQRIWSSLIATLITITAAYVLVANGFIGVERASPPPTIVYRISGVIMDGDRPLSDVKIVLDGKAKAAATATDAEGKYAFTGLPAEKSFTITPLAGDTMTFNPSSRSINRLTKDEAANFEAIVKPDVFKITGRVTDEKRKPLPGIRIMLKGGAKGDWITTDTSGRYAFRNLAANLGYTITPLPTLKITFPGGGHAINNLTKDEEADFTGIVKPDVFKITGRVTDEKGKPLPGIRIMLKGGAKSDWITTDTSGHYAFGNLAANLGYTITPLSSEKITFPRGSRLIPSLTRDETADFSGRTKDGLVPPLTDCHAAELIVREKITARLNAPQGREIKPDRPGVLSPQLQIGGAQTNASLGVIEKITFLEKCSVALVTIRYSSPQVAAVNKNPLSCNQNNGKWLCDR